MPMQGEQKSFFLASVAFNAETLTHSITQAQTFHLRN